jgi:hypothetical protein
MTPLVVLDVSGPSPREAGARLDIFPGGATPAVFPAGSPFWVGYGFAPDASARSPDELVDEDATRFELEVDGHDVEMNVELMCEGGLVVRKSVVAEFPRGLAPGWHELAGRWYDRGKLLFASRADVEFVER